MCKKSKIEKETEVVSTVAIAKRHMTMGGVPRDVTTIVATTDGHVRQWLRRYGHGGIAVGVASYWREIGAMSHMMCFYIGHDEALILDLERIHSVPTNLHGVLMVKQAYGVSLRKQIRKVVSHKPIFAGANNLWHKFLFGREIAKDREVGTRITVATINVAIVEAFGTYHQAHVALRA